MQTLKKAILLILGAVTLITMFAMTVKATTNIEQADATNKQENNSSENISKEPENASKIDTKENSKEEEQEGAVTEIMNPNNKVEVIQYSQEQDEQAIEEQAH